MAAVRRFGMQEELRATADRRRRPLGAQRPGGAGPGAAGHAGRQEGIPDIAARLQGMFPDLPQDTVQAVLSGLFRVDPHVSREALADRAVASLLEMSWAAEPEMPRAITSFGPAATAACDASSGGSEPAGPGDGPAPPGPCVAAGPSGGDPDQALDECLAELLALPDQELHACATTLASILARIAERPDEARVRRLRRANARFEAQVARHACGLGLLRLAGFEEATEDGEPVVALYGDPWADGGGFGKVQESLQGVIEDLGLQPAEQRPAPGGARAPAPGGAGRSGASGGSAAGLAPRGALLDERRRRVAELTEERLRDPRAFREAARRRGAGNRGVGAPLGPRPAAAPVAAPGRRARHFTLADVEQMRIADEIASTPGYAAEYGAAGGRYDPGLIARQAVDGTNAYRASKGLPPLRWSDGIAEIASRHAEQMARGEMPFSHDGFDQRVSAFPVLHRGAGENLALNKGVAEVAKTAVDGWIKSPGHEKNLRGPFNLCGIGVARSSDGTFYLTQLFANAM